MPSTTPLTDAINALTTYANSVTSKTPPDTTLSEAVATLAAGYGGGGVTGLYPLGWSFRASQVEITLDGNHIKIEYLSTVTNQSYFNLRNLSFSTSNNILTVPEWFVIPSGASVEIKYKNVVNASSLIWNANLRKSNQTSSWSYGIGDGTHINGETVRATASTNETVSCLFVFISNSKQPTAGDILEFDVEMTVNGVRYF